jgi:hypothetical protein
VKSRDIETPEEKADRVAERARVNEIAFLAKASKAGKDMVYEVAREKTRNRAREALLVLEEQAF